MTLDGGSQLSLEGTAVQPDLIAAASGGGTLDNFDPIVGSGTVGQGDGTFTLVNEAGGSIEAEVFTINTTSTTGLLTIDTGKAITNSGTLEASSGATLVVADAVTGGGSATIAGARLNLVRPMPKRSASQEVAPLSSSTRPLRHSPAILTASRLANSSI